MLTFQEIAISLVQSLLGAVSQILDQVAALRKQVAALIARVEELSNENAALKAQLDQVHRRGHR